MSESGKEFAVKTFKNPVSPFDAPDPFMTYDSGTGYYYALFTRGRVLELFRSRRAAGRAPRCVVRRRKSVAKRGPSLYNLSDSEPALLRKDCL